VGNLTAHMKSLDLWENTIMIGASDNGTFVVRKNTMVVCVSHSSVVKIDPKFPMKMDLFLPIHWKRTVVPFTR
jgi:arylsulfatase A-like enzyme